MPFEYEISINGIDWTIEEVGSDHPGLNIGDNVQIGNCFNDSCRIYLNKYMPHKQFRRVLMHELGHAFMDSYGFNGFEEFNDEVIVEFMSCYADEIVHVADKYMEGWQDR